MITACPVDLCYVTAEEEHLRRVYFNVNTASRHVLAIGVGKVIRIFGIWTGSLVEQAGCMGDITTTSLNWGICRSQSASIWNHTPTAAVTRVLYTT
jgi:hypothetical protein